MSTSISIIVSGFIFLINSFVNAPLPGPISRKVFDASNFISLII